MRKLTFRFMILLLVFNLIACSSETSNRNSNNNNSNQNSNTTVDNGANTTPFDNSDVQSTDSSNITTNNGEKTLVVYYSATGSTKKVAEYIANTMNADVFELEPVNPYSTADLRWSDKNSRVVYEHDNPSARVIELVRKNVPDWGNYDKVFIGYPIWWGIAAWPVNTFIENNDFTGKTVIPFCTSSSSGLGESGKLLEEAAKTGNWLEGIRFSSGVPEKTVVEWVESLGL